MAFMNGKATIDKAGRLVLPKAIRDELRLRPGDELDIRSEADKITLAPVQSTSALVKEQGIWVYRSGTPAVESLSDIIEEDRGNRHRYLLK